MAEIVILKNAKHTYNSINGNGLTVFSIEILEVKSPGW